MVRERVAAAGRTRLPLGTCVHAMRASGHALYTQAGPVSIALIYIINNYGVPSTPLELLEREEETEVIRV